MIECATLGDLVISKTELEKIENETAGFSKKWLQLIDHLSTHNQNTQTEVIQLQTRFKDWQDGGMSTAFFCRRVNEMMDNFMTPSNV